MGASQSLGFFVGWLGKLSGSQPPEGGNNLEKHSCLICQAQCCFSTPGGCTAQAEASQGRSSESIRSTPVGFDMFLGAGFAFWSTLCEEEGTRPVSFAQCPCRPVHYPTASLTLAMESTQTSVPCSSVRSTGQLKLQASQLCTP